MLCYNKIVSLLGFIFLTIEFQKKKEATATAVAPIFIIKNYGKTIMQGT